MVVDAIFLLFFIGINTHITNTTLFFYLFLFATARETATAYAQVASSKSKQLPYKSRWLLLPKWHRNQCWNRVDLHATVYFAYFAIAALHLRIILQCLLSFAFLFLFALFAARVCFRLMVVCLCLFLTLALISAVACVLLLWWVPLPLP